MESKSEGKPKVARRGRPKGTGFIDLTGVPPQPLILKNQLSATCYKDNYRRRPIKAGSSKYTGIYYDKYTAKWKAQIMVKGVVRSIGYYDKEEDAAADYARAAFKYKEKKGSQQTYGGLDLSGIPKDLPLIRSERSSTGYKGVKVNRQQRYEARIGIGSGINKTLGIFDTAEEAALIFARVQYYLNRKGTPSQDGEKKVSLLLEQPSEETSEANEGGNAVDSHVGARPTANDDEVDEDPVDPCFIDSAGDTVKGVAV